MTNSKNFTITAIYYPPRYALEKLDCLRFFQMLGNHFVIGEDFNAKHSSWGSRTITPKVKHLYSKKRWLLGEKKEQKAHLFAKHLANTLQPYTEPTNNDDNTTIILDTPAEMAIKINKNVSSKIAAGFDLITGQILIELPQKKS